MNKLGMVFFPVRLFNYGHSLCCVCNYCLTCYAQIFVFPTRPAKSLEVLGARKCECYKYSRSIIFRGKCIALSAANLLAPSADFLLALIASMWKTSLRLRESMQRPSKRVDVYDGLTHKDQSCPQSWHVFYLAGAVFGDVGGWRLLLTAWHMMYRLSPGSWQAQYLVMLEGDTCCSPHWKWRFICDQDRGKHSIWWVWDCFGSIKSETGNLKADVANDHFLKCRKRCPNDVQWKT